eukprot:6365092-Prymnesium_polylepis.1
MHSGNGEHATLHDPRRMQQTRAHVASARAHHKQGPTPNKCRRNGKTQNLKHGRRAHEGHERSDADCWCEVNIRRTHHSL